MVTIKPILHSRADKTGKYPVAIRITKNRKSSFVFTGITLDQNQWDKSKRVIKKNYPNSGRANALLAKLLSDTHKEYLNLELKDKAPTAKAIHKTVKSDSGQVSFLKYADNYLDLLQKEGKYNRYKADEPRIKRFKTFLKHKDAAFEDVTPGLLMRFKAYLKDDHKVSERTAINYLIVLRTIYNQGLKEGVIDLKHYPFGRGKISLRFPESIKLGLTREEIKQIVDLDLSLFPKEANARKIWLTSFYFAGMRISDVLLLKWSDIKDERLYYKMAKNDKVVSLKIPVAAKAIFEECYAVQPPSPKTHDLIFSELSLLPNLSDKYLLQRKISYAVKNTNKYLGKLAKRAQIDKKLTTHIARHSFGAIAGDTIPIQMLQKLYRHSDIQTTINYQKSFINKDADDALDAVLSF